MKGEKCCRCSTLPYQVFAHSQCSTPIKTGNEIYESKPNSKSKHGAIKSVFQIQKCSRLYKAKPLIPSKQRNCSMSDIEDRNRLLRLYDDMTCQGSSGKA